MTAWSTEPWHIGPSTVGATTIDRDIDVPDVPTWETPAPARKAIDPCNATVTMLYRSDVETPAQATITFVIPADDELADVMSDLTAFWTLKGPWDLTDAEGVTRSVVADPTRGSWVRTNQGIYRTVAIPVQEV